MLTKAATLKLRGDLQRTAKLGLARSLSVLGDGTRFHIFRLLTSQPELLCVSEIAAVVGTSVPAVSQQLRLMEVAGFVTRDRDGQKICYRANKANPLVRDLTSLIKRYHN